MTIILDGSDRQYAYNHGYEDAVNRRPNRELREDWHGCEDDYAFGYAEGMDDIETEEPGGFSD